MMDIEYKVPKNQPGENISYKSRRYEYLKSIGACVKCSKKGHIVEAMKDRSLCKKCMSTIANYTDPDYNRKYRMERREILRRSGLCVYCSDIATTGMASCLPCRIKHAKKYGKNKLVSNITEETL